MITPIAKVTVEDVLPMNRSSHLSQLSEQLSLIGRWTSQTSHERHHASKLV
jgi:hypothetical protein